ncbi:MAG: Hsp70 family protein [Desulfamplus sp.]|nr:Hsp70 family protein [Desulfamplus sp.]MBF0259279.1 Hsp70 family protein [Desulfamplus sp.]
MKNARYIVGIDLGTTNSVVAYSDTQSDEMSNIRIFQILQLTDSGVIDKRDVLPSFLYIKDGHEMASESLKMPWNDSNSGEAVDAISSELSMKDFDSFSESYAFDNFLSVGEFARERGSEVPHKLISSSKSWLCNKAVDRESPILPWEAIESAKKISPVHASCAILQHIKNAWNHEFGKMGESFELQNQAIYLTVPASFDAVARELTVKSAKLAGFGNIVLIEEPQAAFYSWIDQSGDKWRKNVKKGDVVLVCDIGGGTSDFSLIEVKEGQNGILELERVAVGDHLLVGGDNIDFALSYFLAARLREKNRKLDAWQMRGLVHSCRKAKEYLFGNEGIEEHQITILGRGSGLIKGTIKQNIAIQDVDKVVLDGFFPICDFNDKPASSNMSGLKEFGLSYEADPAITRHLAKFLSAHCDEQGKPMLPTAVVFNGGVMKSQLIRNRLMDILSKWHQEHEQSLSKSVENIDTKNIREIEAVDFDLSVARGAVYYGQAARGDGIKIRGGLGKSYYMAIEASMPAVPGIPMPTRALCIAPFGMEEGTQAESRERLFNLVVGEKVKFDIMASSTRHEDMVGHVVDNWEDMDIVDLTSIETVLEGSSEGFVPVTFEVKVTEVGTLEFWACSRDDDRKWRLELNVRPKE